MSRGGRSRRSTSNMCATGSTPAVGTTSHHRPRSPTTWSRRPRSGTARRTSGSAATSSTGSASGRGCCRDGLHVRGPRVAEAGAPGAAGEGRRGLAPGDGFRRRGRRAGRQAHQADGRRAGRGGRDRTGPRDGDQGPVQSRDRGLRGTRGGRVVTRLPRVGVVTFPGSLDDADARRAVEAMGGEAVALWHGDHDLGDVDAVVLPGGFSYGDYLRCGAIAARAPIMSEVRDFAGRGGPVVGICNGFQILCEAGLLPGALARNASLRFVCRHVYVRVEGKPTPFTSAIPAGRVLRLPIAHAEGRFVCDDSTALGAKGQVVFRYCDQAGGITETANPNGSQLGIAGVCNEAGNVLALMPHPERASEG